MDWLQNIATRLFFNSKNPIDVQEDTRETEDKNGRSTIASKSLPDSTC
jgi:hypothetical protein